MAARRSTGLFIFVAVTAVVCLAVSVMAIAALVALAPTRVDRPSSLLLISVPAWLEAGVFAAPGAALAVMALLVRRRPEPIGGLAAALLAVVAVSAMVFVIAAGGQWAFCSLSCIASVPDTDQLIRASRSVEDLLFDAGFVSVAGIPLSLAAGVWTLVVGLRNPRASEDRE